MRATIARLPDRAPTAQEQPTAQTLERILEELRTLNSRFDEFAGVQLNTRFPYGKPTDRWGRRGR